MTLSPGRALVDHSLRCGLIPTTRMTSRRGAGGTGSGASTGSGEGVAERECGRYLESEGRWRREESSESGASCVGCASAGAVKGASHRNMAEALSLRSNAPTL